MEKEEEEEEEGDDERTVMDTSHEHTAVHWTFSSRTGSSYLSKNLLEKCYASVFFWDFFYINGRFDLFYNLKSSYCFINWDKKSTLSPSVETLLY